MDIFNANTGLWSTAALSVARERLAATSLPNQGLAIFAGGEGGLRLCTLADDAACYVFCDELLLADAVLQ